MPACLLLLLMNCMVNAEDTISSFVRDMMTTFHLSSPTIVYDGDEAPEICYTDPWVLCFSTQVEKRDKKDFEYNTKSNESITEGGCLFCACVNHAYEDLKIVIIHLLCNLMLVSILLIGECLTSAGPSSGERCIFPFMLGEKTYNACTRDGHTGAAEINGDPWCSTKVDDNRAHILGNWGGCSHACPVEEGCNCNFPFKYQGVTHSACTMHNSVKMTGQRMPWCSITLDALGNHVLPPLGNWASCSQKCPFEIGKNYH